MTEAKEEKKIKESKNELFGFKDISIAPITTKLIKKTINFIVNYVDIIMKIKI